MFNNTERDIFLHFSRQLIASPLECLLELLTIIDSKIIHKKLDKYW